MSTFPYVPTKTFDRTEILGFKPSGNQDEPLRIHSPSIYYEGTYHEAISIPSLGMLIFNEASRIIDRSAQTFAARERTAALTTGRDVDMFTTIGGQLNQTLAEIQKMSSWGDGTDDDPTPTPQVLSYAQAWITGLYLQVTNAGFQWVKPNVTVCEAHEVVFDWWNGKKALGVYVTSQQAMFIKEWGIHIHTEMEDGDALPPKVGIALWSWLYSDE